MGALYNVSSATGSKGAVDEKGSSENNHKAKITTGGQLTI
jgi:hypothetical protein